MTKNDQMLASIYVLNKGVYEHVNENIFDLIQENIKENTSDITLVGISAFGDNLKRKNIDSIEQNKSSYKKPLKNYLMYRFEIKDINELNNIKASIHGQLFKLNNKEVNYVIYPDTKQMPKYRRIWFLVIPLTRYLDKKQYTLIHKYVQEALAVPQIKNEVPISMKKAFSLPAAASNDSDYFVNVELHTNNELLLFSDEFMEKHGIKDEHVVNENEPVNTYKSDKVIAAYKKFLEQADIKKFKKDELSRKTFFTSMSVSVYDNVTPKEVIKTVLEKFSSDNNKTIEEQRNDFEKYKNEYSEINKEIQSEPSKRQTALPIGSYIQLYSSKSSSNLGEQILQQLDSDFIASSDLSLEDAGNIIATVFPPSLLDQSGKNKDNVVIFNPLDGTWTHDEDLFMVLLNTIKPYSTSYDLQTMLDTFATNAYNGNRFIKPYSGSRYLLFKNGALDIITMKLHDLDDPLIRNINFVERSRLNIDYKPHTALNDYPDDITDGNHDEELMNSDIPYREHGKQIDGSMWDIKSFIDAYGNNDPEKIQYFLFGLSLGLFGGHNFGVHFDIQGESRWGKTTLSEIFNKLYNNHTVIISFSALNGRFPFTNYPLNTSLIWIKESNIGTDKLDDEHGTVIYDGLADNQTRFEVKGTNDILLDNPPPVVIDGTQFVQSNEITTGPAGRTLAYKLPQATAKLKGQAYANDIVSFLHSDDVLSWLVYQMILCFKKIVPEERISNFKMNLGMTKDLSMLPGFARDWRKEFADGTGTLDTWFIEEVEPYLSYDPEHWSLMNAQILYALYEASYNRNNPHDKYSKNEMPFEEFKRRIISVINNHGWKTIEQGKSYGRSRSKRKKVSKLSSLNFDWATYERSYQRPLTLKDPQELSNVFGVLLPGWYTIEKDEENA